MNKSELKNLSKIELEKLGRTKGVELDRRFNKKTLIEQLTGLFAKESTTEAPVEEAPPVVRVSFGDRYNALKNR